MSNVKLIQSNKLKENASTKNFNHKIEDNKLIMEFGKMPTSMGPLSVWPIDYFFKFKGYNEIENL